MKPSQKSIKALIGPYFVIVALFFLLSLVQEAGITKRFNWSIILFDFSTDTLFLTIAFVFFYILLNRLYKGNNILVEQRQRYQQVLDNMMEGIQILSTDWRYVYLNDAGVRQSQYSREELIGHTIIEKYPLIEHSDMFKHLQKCMNDKVIANIENEFKYPNGKSRYFELFIEPVPEGLFILSMDISERKAREKERNDRIKETQKILFKISHEVRVPIANIIGLAGLFTDNLVEEKELVAVSQMMKQSVFLLDERTKDLSSYISSLNTAD